MPIECKKINILGVKIDKISGNEAMQKIEGFLHSDKNHYIVTANSEIIVKAQKDREFFEIINSADLVLSDGSGPIFASKFFSSKEKLTERIAGIDLVYKIAQSLNDSVIKHRIFFLGAKEGVAKLTAEKLKKLFPNLEIAGTFSGSPDEKADRIAVSIINQAKPDILFVAYGAPKQEKWIARNLKNMPGVKLAIGVGGAFDIISGRIKRAPLWMRNIGIEWLWRLIKGPRRIGRIYNATIKFSWLVLTKR